MTFGAKVLLLTLISWTSLSSAQQDLNVVNLKGGVELRLPEFPTDPVQLASFQALSPSQQRSFYLKRKFIVELLQSGLTRPGLRSAVRWVKGRFTRASATASVAQVMGGEGALEWVSSPEGLTDKSKMFVESTVTALVDNLWSNSEGIANSNGLGFTFVGGGIFNTTLGRFGLVKGRGVSLDLGVDFKTQTGYMRVNYDKQELMQGGLSFDVGLMLDVLVHVTNPDLEQGDNFNSTHTKYPIIGCFRDGPNYKAWGMQMGVGALEFVGGWLAVTGEPALGTGLITATRAIGFATVYKTSLERQILWRRTLSESTMRRLGMAPLWNLAKTLALPVESCAEDLSSAG